MLCCVLFAGTCVHYMITWWYRAFYCFSFNRWPCLIFIHISGFWGFWVVFNWYPNLVFWTCSLSVRSVQMFAFQHRCALSCLLVHTSLSFNFFTTVLKSFKSVKIPYEKMFSTFHSYAFCLFNAVQYLLNYNFFNVKAKSWNLLKGNAYFGSVFRPDRPHYGQTAPQCTCDTHKRASNFCMQRKLRSHAQKHIIGHCLEYK